MVLLLAGAGLWLSAACGFLPLRHPGVVARYTLGSLFSRGKGAGVSPLAAVSAALAGTLGTGNIAGVAAAIAAGGPGAVFWMWASALFGMSPKYAEVLLAVEYRVKDRRGRWQGGPMEYMARGLGAPGLAAVFSAACALCSFGIGSAAQAGAVAQVLEADFSLPPLLTGGAMALAAGLVVMGGFGRIAAFAQGFIPFMALFYLGAGALVLWENRAGIPGALSLILEHAFTPGAAAGGAAGWGVRQAVRTGAARGLFTNEAGLGSAPIAHGGADALGPAQQGCWGIFEVFVDTVLVCGFTGLVILSEGELWQSGLSGAALTSAVFRRALGPAGGLAVSLSLVFFAFSSVLGWAYYGERAVGFLTGGSPGWTRLYRLCYLGAMVPAAGAGLPLLWRLSDLLNTAMLVPNLAAVLALRAVVRRRTRELLREDGKSAPAS